MEKWIIILGCLFQIGIHRGSTETSRYTALIQESMTYGSASTNAQFYGITISSARNFFDADIIVFPEGTLTPDYSSSVPVPEPEDKIIPHKHKYYNKYDVLSIISKAAANEKVYVVTNLYERIECSQDQKQECPPIGFLNFNTDVVFDRNGTVIAKYRKTNKKSYMDKPEKADLVVFTTDFGVTYGVFTGFDILFKTPAIDLVRQMNVTHFVHPSRWHGDLPFLTSVQVHSGWSYALNVTLLVSGASKMRTGSSGSGIYFGRTRRHNWMSEREGVLYIYHEFPIESKMVVRESVSNREYDGLKLTEDPSIPLASGKNLSMKATTFSQKICHGDVCCMFNAKYRIAMVSNPENYSYRAVVFQGTRAFQRGAHLNETYCAIVLCTNGNCAKKPTNGNYPLIFDKINIQGQFDTKSGFQMPSTLVYKNTEEGARLFNTMEYDQFSYECSENPRTKTPNVSISLKKPGIENLITFGIFGTFE